MALLGAIAYDPSTAVNTATTLTKMTAVDTTNCRVTFTAPASGNILVRIKTTMNGGTSGATNSILVGVLESATVIGRCAPLGGSPYAASSARNAVTSEFAVTGVSAGSHNYDLAIGVQVIGNASGVSYGGPNNSTTNDAWGAITMEVWEATNLLAASNYDPAVQVSKSTASLLPVTAFDTTHLRCTFTAPASGNVLTIVRANWVSPSTSTTCGFLLGVLESSTVVARQAPMGGFAGRGAAVAGSYATYEAAQVVTGVTAGSHSYDASYGVEIVLASSNIKYGGPDDATGADAAGMLRFEVWSA